MKQDKPKPALSIRMDPEILHFAKIEAVKHKMTIGSWVEEAVKEKIKRDKK